MPKTHSPKPPPRPSSRPPLPPPLGKRPPSLPQLPPPPPAEECGEQHALGQLAQLAEEERESRQREVHDWMFTVLPGGMCSAVVHLLLIIGMGLCLLSVTKYGGEVISIEVAEADILTEEDVLNEVSMEVEPLPAVAASDESRDESWDSEVFDNSEQLVLGDVTDGIGALVKLAASIAGPVTREMHDGEGFGQGHRNDGFEDLAGRAQRRQQALSYGASLESEKAVELALQWLARHQRQDGAWSFNHKASPQGCKNCRCPDPGSNGALNGATAMALLPFLGAGQTHLEGRYQSQVESGLLYLINHQQRDGSFIDSHGRMYSHGLATLALCEALAMTQN